MAIMKNILKYLLCGAIALIAMACEKDDIVGGGEGEVNFAITLTSNTRTSTTPTTPTSVRMRIYRADGKLVRYYSTDDEEGIPTSVNLVAGAYSIHVEAGDATLTNFVKNHDESAIDKLCYESTYTNTSGTTNTIPFTVEAGKSVSVEVNCIPKNVKTNVVFAIEETVTITVNGQNQTVTKKVADNEKLKGVQICAVTASSDFTSTTYDEFVANAEKDNLPYVELAPTADGQPINQDAYFLLPEGVSSLRWAFSGVYNDGLGGSSVVDVFSTGTLNVESGKAYRLSFKYSKTPGGGGLIYVEVDENLEIHKDLVVFTPQPSIVIPSGSDIKLMDVNNVIPGQPAVMNMTSLSPMTAIYMTVNNGSRQQIYSHTSTFSSSGGVDGVTCTVKDTERKLIEIKIEDEFFSSLGGGDVNLTFEAADEEQPSVEDSSYSPINLAFANPGIISNRTTMDLWANTATFSVNATQSSQEVGVMYRRKDSSEWVTKVFIPSSVGVSEITTDAVWSAVDGKQYFIPDPNKSFFLGGEYEYQFMIGEDPYGPVYLKTAALANGATQTIPDVSVLDSGSFWGCGNNTFSPSLCTINDNGVAVLQATAAANMLASGNLFTGSFKFSLFEGSGTVSFGRPYTWTARPTALHLKYYANIGKVDQKGKKDNPDIPMDWYDQGAIMVCIVAWDSQHQVTSGTGDVSGVWSPEDGPDAVSAGKIIGYGVVYPTNGMSSSDGSLKDLEIPIYYYDKTTNPSGSNYSLVISCATSRYGDYANGCSSSTMHIDDISWVYSTPQNTYVAPELPATTE